MESNSVFWIEQLSDPTKSCSPKGYKNRLVPNERKKVYTESKSATHSSGTPIFPVEGGNNGGGTSEAS